MTAEPQAAEPILDDVIACAVLHDLHRALLADGPRNDDEGNVQPTLLDNLQGTQRVEIRHGKIGENDFGGRFQMFQEVLLAVHPNGARIVVRMPQGVQN